jgi:hypothetical protein
LINLEPNDPPKANNIIAALVALSFISALRKTATFSQLDWSGGAFAGAIR